MSMLIQSETLKSGEVDLVMSFLREQDQLLKELMQDIEGNSVSHLFILQRVIRIESNFRNLRSVIH